MSGHGDAFDTSAGRVRETPNRVHVGMEHAIEQVAKRLHSSYCECEGWHAECQGPQVGDRRVARRLAAEGLIAPAPEPRADFADAWDEGWEACHAFMGRGILPPRTNPYREPVDRAEGDGSADQ